MCAAYLNLLCPDRSSTLVCPKLQLTSLRGSHVQQRAGKRKPGPKAAGLTELVSLCQVPFVLTPKAKARVLQTEATLQKQEQMRAGSMQARPHALLTGGSLTCLFWACVCGVHAYRDPCVGQHGHRRVAKCAGVRCCSHGIPVKLHST